MDDPTEQEPTAGGRDRAGAPDAGGQKGADAPDAGAEPAAPPAASTGGPDEPAAPDAASAEGPAEPAAEKPPAEPAAPAPEAPPRTPAAPAAGGGPKPLYKQPVFAIAALALLIGSIVAGNVIFKREAPTGANPSPSPTASPSPTEPATKDYRNVEAGIVFKYPAEWGNLKGQFSQNTIAALGTGRGELLRLEVFLLEEAPTPQAVASRDVQDLLDKNIAQNPDATVTLRELKTVNGTNAWHYIAQFEDKDLGVGVWDVWFFFSGSKLEKLLFQAFPLSEYNTKYRAIFDGIVATYRTVPRAPGGTPAPPPTGSPPPSPAA